MKIYNMRPEEDTMISDKKQEIICNHCDGEGKFEFPACGEGCCWHSISCLICDGLGKLSSAEHEHIMSIRSLRD